MRIRNAVWVVGLLIAFGVGVLFLRNVDSERPAKDAARVSRSTADSVSTEAPAPATVTSQSPTPSKEIEAEAQEPTGAGVFRLDPAGNIVLDEDTRLRIEELVALTPAGMLDDAVRDQTKDMPAATAQRARELIEQFTQYKTAQKTSYPPGVAPANEDAALTQLDGIHALRVAHFGESVANAFYAREEKLARELLELMRNEKDPTLSMADKADRAQRLYAESPTLAAIEAQKRAQNREQTRATQEKNAD